MKQSITVDGITYCAVDASKCRQQIIILHRGWVFVGDIEETSDLVTVHNAKNIRRWGTSRGLGELNSGSLADTKVDDYGTVEVHPQAIIGRINVCGW